MEKTDNKDFNILDDKFEVAGSWPTNQPLTTTKTKDKLFRYFGVAAAAAAVAAGIYIWVRSSQTPQIENGVFDPLPTNTVRPVLKHLGDTSTNLSYTERLDTVINDVRLSVYLPHRCLPELTIGVPDINDPSIILAAQAADVRADNGKILGAFVLKGEPKAWGLSKKGYCAILDGKITVGVSENSPLFEEATEREGYFFRQYPLVDNGALVDNEPKNKTMRKALCSRSGQTLMVVSESDESFHDFAQALVDLGVDDAVYLVGSHTSYGWYKDETGTLTEFAKPNARKVYKNETYIIWREQ